MGKRIVIVTSGQPSANPRMVKEATSLYSLGYDVTVIYCPLSPWADSFDQQIFQEFRNINWVRAGYHTFYQPVKYKFARLRRKWNELLFKIFKDKYHVAEKSVSLFFQELRNEAMKHPADIYIGHNVAALPIVVKAARKYHAKALFDFEDFHRGEDIEHTLHWMRIKIIEDRYVRFLYHATASSELITHVYQTLYPALKIITIKNCFPFSYAGSEPANLPNQPLQLFWFSQYVGKNRGLETIIKAISRLPPKTVVLTLLGNISDANRNYFISLLNAQGLDNKQIVFSDPIAVEDIVRNATSFHIGIASEPSSVLNKEYCLANKIFIYLLAGNAILFSNTSAHERFLSENPGIGIVYDQNDPESLAAQLMNYLTDPHKLHSERNTSRYLGRNIFNWEKEQEKLLALVSSILD